MKLLFTIAIRNIARHKRRTILSSITIAFGFLVFITMDSLLKGMDQDAIENLIRLSTSAIKITTERYDREKSTLPLDYGIGNTAAIEQAVRADNRVRGVTRRTQFLGQLSNYIESVPVVGTVIDERTDSAVFDMVSKIEGAYFSGDNTREIILGKRLAEDLGVSTGDYITLFALTRYESRNADEFKIVGCVNSTDPMLNRSGAFITFSAADDFLDLERLVTELDVSLKGRFNDGSYTAAMRRIQGDLRSRFPGLSVNTFLELAADFFQISKTKATFGIIFIGFILVIAGVGIFNSVFMSVCERTREIGVLRAHGMKGGQITVMFLLEGTLTGLFGGILGVILGTTVNYCFVRWGIPFDKMISDTSIGNFPVWGTFYGIWNAGAFIFAFVFSVFMATVAGWLPARRASKMEVTDALRFA